MIAGITVFIIARLFLGGERWARALTMFCLSVPAVGGAYMFVPWMNFVGSTKEGIGMFSSLAVIICLIGLVRYFAVLLTGLGDVRKKTIYFLVYGAMGVLAHILLAMERRSIES